MHQSSPLLQGMIQEIQQKKLLSAAGLPRENYEDAIAKTYLWLVENYPKYNPEYNSPKGITATVIAFFNGQLKYRILDEKREIAQNQQRFKFSQPNSKGIWLDPVENIPSEENATAREIRETLKIHQVELEQITMISCPVVNAYNVTLHQFDQYTMRAIAQMYSVNESSLGYFFKRKCVPKLKKIYQDFLN